MMPQHANNLGHVFGGVILSLLDRVAAVSAIRHARQNCVTVSVDRVDFREPIHLGDLVIMQASVNFVGRTSMEVGVRVEAEDLSTGARRHTNSCYLTFVAIDKNHRPDRDPADRSRDGGREAAVRGGAGAAQEAAGGADGGADRVIRGRNRREQGEPGFRGSSAPVCALFAPVCACRITALRDPSLQAPAASRVPRPFAIAPRETGRP